MGVGSSVEQYTILDPISIQGRLGDLFRARDTKTGRTVALRVVRDEIAGDPARRAALLEDARAAGGLSHPHIAALFDAGEQDGLLYLVHEYVPGQPLSALLARGPLEIDLALDLALQIADALAHIHRHGLLFRALSPAAVLVTPRDQVKLLDVGLAAWTNALRSRLGEPPEFGAGQERHDEGVAPAEAPASYISPEEALGEEPPDPRSDLFSLGVLLYQMVTGRLPFAGGSDAGTALKILRATPPAPSSLNPALPLGLDAVVSQLLRKSLDARWRDAQKLVRELRRLREAAATPQAAARDQPARPRAPAVPPPRRGTLRGWILASILLALGAAAAAWWTLP